MRFRADVSLDVILLVCATAGRLLPGPGANLGFAVLALYALRGNAQAVVALAASWLFMMVNPGLVASTDVTLGRYLVIGAAAVSVLARSMSWNRKLTIQKTVLYTFGLGLAIVVHSLFFSAIVEVSLLKILSWTTVMTTALAAWAHMDRVESARLGDGLRKALVGVLLLSLPLAVMPVGYLRNSVGFQGVLNHPQPFGLLSGIVVAWSLARAIRSPRPAWSLLVVIALASTFVVMSETRTAGVALVGGLAIVGMVLTITAKSEARRLPGLRSGRLLAVMGSVLIVSLFLWPAVSEGVTSFITKRSAQTTVLDAYESSRGFLIREMLANIESRPLSGIGFGIASSPSEMNVARDALLGLPVSAAVEKGVAPLAWLEELGLFVFGAVVLWLVALVRRALANGVEETTLLLVMLAMNLGEAVLFSPGGMGLLMLLLLGWAARPMHLANETTLNRGPLSRREFV